MHQGTRTLEHRQFLSALQGCRAALVVGALMRGETRFRRLCQASGVPPWAVRRVLRRLRSGGWAQSRYYGYWSLTQAGQRLAADAAPFVSRMARAEREPAVEGLCGPPSGDGTGQQILAAGPVALGSDWSFRPSSHPPIPSSVAEAASHHAVTRPHDGSTDPP